MVSSDSPDDLIRPVIERLYENESLTGALTDEAAQVLLAWGQEELAGLARFDPDPDEVEAVVRQAQRVLRAVNRIMEQRAALSDPEMVAHLLRLIQRAMALGVKEFMIERGMTDDQAT